MSDDYGCTYVTVTKQPIARTVEVSQGVLVDMDAAGGIVGVEVIN